MNHYGYCPICGVDVRIKVDATGYWCDDRHFTETVLTPAEREAWLEKRREGDA